MTDHNSEDNDQCGCGCSGHFDRREFMAMLGVATGGTMFTSVTAAEIEQEKASPNKRPKVAVVFLFPDSSTFSGEKAWWSWPGNDFDAEGRMKKYVAELRKIEDRLGVELDIRKKNIYGTAQANAFAAHAKKTGADGVLMVLFYNNSRGDADAIVRGIGDIPATLYVGLGVTHRRAALKLDQPGLHYIQSLDNFDSIEYAIRMMATRRRMADSRIVGIDGNSLQRTNLKPFGTEILRVPTADYVKIFDDIADDDPRLGPLMTDMSRGAMRKEGLTPASLPNAARAHLAISQLLQQYDGNAVTMRCLRMGQYKPCMSFARLNGQLTPAACEYDVHAATSLMLIRYLFDKPGFMHNPSMDTEEDLYYASHCTCTPLLTGTGGEASRFLLRRFAHTNDRSAAIQVFWDKDMPVTVMIVQGDKLWVSGGRTVVSHEMPPVGGCTTNVLVQLDQPEKTADMVSNGAHAVVFHGNNAKRLRQFGNLMKMEVMS